MTPHPTNKDIFFHVGSSDTPIEDDHYKTGWYFTDECEQFNGPFDTSSAAIRAYYKHCERL